MEKMALCLDGPLKNTVIRIDDVGQFYHRVKVAIAPPTVCEHMEGDGTVALDIKKAYHEYEIHPGSRSAFMNGVDLYLTFVQTIPAGGT